MKLTWNTPPIASRLAIYTWSAPYAIAVHEGATRIDGTQMPARPWTEAAIEETDLEAVLAENFKKTTDIVEAFEDSAFYLAGRFETMIRDERWKWDRLTLRQNGELAGYVRNAVDSETLVNSQTLELR